MRSNKLTKVPPFGGRLAKLMSNEVNAFDVTGVPNAERAIVGLSTLATVSSK